MSDISVGHVPMTGATFRIGAVLSKTFTVLGRQFGKFFLLSLLPMIPALLFTLLTISAARNGTPVAGFGIWSAAAGIITFILQIIAQATTLFGAFQEMRGQPFTVGDSTAMGLRRAVPVIGVALLAGILTGLAALLLVIPGIIVLCMLYVAIPACVIEKLGVTASLGRSSNLTKGYRWPIFGIMLLVAVVGLIIMFVLGFLTFGNFVALQILVFAWKVIATAFGAVLAAVIYHDLRVAKEGIDIENLANIFD